MKNRCTQIFLYILKEERDNISVSFHFSVTPTPTAPHPTCCHINISWPLVLMSTLIWLDPRNDIQILSNQKNMGKDQSEGSSAMNWYLIDSLLLFFWPKRSICPSIRPSIQFFILSFSKHFLLTTPCSSWCYDWLST